MNNDNATLRRLVDRQGAKIQSLRRKLGDKMITDTQAEALRQAIDALEQLEDAWLDAYDVIDDARAKALIAAKAVTVIRGAFREVR